MLEYPIFLYLSLAYDSRLIALMEARLLGSRALNSLCTQDLSISYRGSCNVTEMLGTRGPTGEVGSYGFDLKKIIYEH